VDDATALDAAVDMLACAHGGARSVDSPLFAQRVRARPRGSGRHDDVNVIQRERQKPRFLEQAAARGHGYGVVSAIR